MAEVMLAALGVFYLLETLCRFMGLWTGIYYGGKTTGRVGWWMFRTVETREWRKLGAKVEEEVGNA